MKLAVVASQLVIAVAGLLSLITFSYVMFVTDNIGWLLLGWFGFPVTALVWPAILGAWWAWPFYIAVVVSLGIALWEEAQ